jgi:CubicO group peptidase (beta-lactamase class C family)
MRTYFLAIALLITHTIIAQQNKPVKRLDGTKVTAETLTRQIKHIVDTARIMGLSVVIINDGNIVYKKTFGLKKAATNAPLDDSTEMYAASFTKPLSAYLFLKLVDKGIFNPDTPLYKYLKKPIGQYEKWQDLANDPAFEKITPAMILSHSSGLPILRCLYNNKLNLIAQPGAKFYYSNEGMNLLGFTIEEYTGKKLQELAAEYIYQPLLMKNTAMVWQPSFDANYALGYSKTAAVLGMPQATTAKAAGSMTTIADDYAKFVTTLMERKGLSSRLFDNMFSPHIKIISRKGFGPQRDSLTNKYDQSGLSWGLGVGLFQSTHGKAFFHTGHGDGWQNYFVAYPGKKIAIVLMSNSDNFEHAGGALLKLCIGDTVSPLEWLGYYDNND